MINSADTVKQLWALKNVSLELKRGEIFSIIWGLRGRKVHFRRSQAT